MFIIKSFKIRNLEFVIFNDWCSIVRELSELFILQNIKFAVSQNGLNFRRLFKSFHSYLESIIPVNMVPNYLYLVPKIKLKWKFTFIKFSFVIISNLYTFNAVQYWLHTKLLKFFLYTYVESNLSFRLRFLASNCFLLLDIIFSNWVSEFDVNVRIES